MAKYGMSDAEYRNMQQWCAKYRNNQRVLRWLKKSPPPSNWQGTRMEWAYTEMSTLTLE